MKKRCLINNIIVMASLIFFLLLGCGVPNIQTTPNPTSILPTTGEQSVSLDNDDINQSTIETPLRDSELIPPNEIDVTILNESNRNIIESLRIFTEEHISPDGQWAWSMGDENFDGLRIHPLNNPNNLFTVQLSTNGVSFLSWSPDSTGLVFSDRVRGNYTNPVEIVNIADGAFSSSLTYNDPDNHIDQITWSPSGEVLYLFDYSFDDNLIQGYRFNRQMELLATFEFQLDLNQNFVDIFPLDNGLLLIQNIFDGAPPFPTTDHQNTTFTTYIYYYSFEEHIVALVNQINNSQLFRFCGNSRDSRYVMIRGYNPYNPGDREQFIILDVQLNIIDARYDFNSPPLSDCVDSEDHSIVAITLNDNTSTGMILYYWEDHVFRYLDGEYSLLGWNYTYNGFTVIDQSQEGIYTIEVLSLQ